MQSLFLDKAYDAHRSIALLLAIAGLSFYNLVCLLSPEFVLAK